MLLSEEDYKIENPLKLLRMRCTVEDVLNATLVSHCFLLLLSFLFPVLFFILLLQWLSYSVHFFFRFSFLCLKMPIGLCIVSTKSTPKLKFWILRIGCKRRTRIGITWILLPKFVLGLMNFFNYLLENPFLIVQSGLFHTLMCLPRIRRMTVHFFIMLYLENYDGGNREMKIIIDKVS